MEIVELRQRGNRSRVRRNEPQNLVVVGWRAERVVRARSHRRAASSRRPFGGFRRGRVVLVREWSKEYRASVERAGRELHARTALAPRLGGAGRGGPELGHPSAQVSRDG